MFNNWCDGLLTVLGFAVIGMLTIAAAVVCGVWWLCCHVSFH